ncbi:SpaA isopeptide-forming pilin-related protein [Clostridium sp. JNZ X4-2]
MGNDVDKNSEIHANYTWSIPNSVDVNSGDYYKMQLPAQIHIAAPIDQPINDDNGTKVADMHVDKNGLVTLTFTDYPSTHSNVSGYFYIDCHFEESEIGNNNPVTITFTIPGISDPVIVDVDFEQPEPSITKDVVNKGYDAATDEITWKLTVNKENVNVKSASVEDIINAGQVFVPGSVTVNGSPADTSNYSYDSSSKKFIYNFGDITAQQVITFKTSIHDDLATKGQSTGDGWPYSNKAVLKYNDNGTPQTIISNTKTVDVPVKLISKDGTYNSSTKQIDWTITVNESGRVIDNAVVTDIIPEGLTLIGASVKVDGNAGSSYTMLGQLFTYSLGSITEKKVITFSTSVDQNVYNSNNSPTYNNTAALTGDGVTDGTSASKGVGVPTNIIRKTGSRYNAATGIITWTITVNDNKTNVAAGAVVTDNIPAGQTYVAGSAGIDDTSNGSFTTLSDGKVVYTFNNGFSKTYTITFQTQVTDPTHYRANYSDIYSNPVNLTADGINQDTNGTQQVTSNVITKTGEGYDYSTREITWKIVVNKNAMPITNAVVTDVIPEGQRYVAGSASIDDGANGSFTTLSDNQVIYTFNGTINKTYTIIFKTKLTDLSIFNTSGNKILNNTASITGDEIPTDGDASSTGTQTVKNSVVTKKSTYTSGNSYIDWTVKANANWSIPLAGTTITSATITDKLQDGLSLDTDTVELYKATVNADGSLAQGDKVALTADNVKYNPDTREFDFTFPQDAGTGAFILNFRTNVTKTGDYTNSVEFVGSRVDENSTTTQNGVWFSQGGGGATGETGSINVVKVSDDGDTKLSGAVFQLLDQYGNVKETSAPTGADGAALFDKLKYDTNYSVKEIKAPTGYNLSSEIHTFQISNASAQKDITYNFEDTRKTGKVTFTKTGEDSDSTVLSGAEFTLYKPDGITPVKDENGSNITATSDSDGKVTFNCDVPYGYKIIETKAPTGYSINSNPLTATVDGSGNVVLDKNTISDSKIRNDVQFTKEDQNGNPLQGAVFKLYKNDDADFENPIQTATSDENGIVKFTDVAYGYKIKEITPPTGYNPSDKVLTVTMSQDGKSVQLDEDNNTVTDNIMTGNIIFTKIGEDSDAAGLKGAEFTLYDEDGATKAVDSSGNVIAPVISDVSGVVKFENVPYGIYKIVETNRPDNYNPYEGNIVADLTQITQNGQDAVITVDSAPISSNNTISDTKIRGNIQFKKTDQNGNPLKGAVFTLYKIGEDGKTLTAVKGADGKDLTAVSGADDVEGAAVTDGLVTFRNIEYGSYAIKETTPPSGYYLSSKVLDANITEDGSTVYARPAGDTESDIYSLSDTRIPGGGGSIQGNITLKKTDEGGNALSGAVFTLYNSSGNPVQTATSDASGAAQFTKVQPGKYTVKETVAPAGYVLSTQVIPVEINMSKTYDIGTVKDTKNAAAIEVKKTDANGNALSGAEFTLYNSGVKVASAVSGQDGIARFDNVVYGNYTIKETRAPAGYDLNQDTLSVQVDSLKTYQFTVVDEKGTPGPNNPGGTPNPNNPGGGTPDSNNPGGGTPNPNNPGGGTPDLSNPQGGTPGSISQSLPKTGSMVDTAVLLAVGIMAILAGIWMMIRSKRSEKTSR